MEDIEKLRMRVTNKVNPSSKKQCISKIIKEISTKKQICKTKG